MRRVIRPALPSDVSRRLSDRQMTLNRRRDVGYVDVEALWKASRSSSYMRTIQSTLERMTGPRQRCMYCVDSHAGDIEHYRPKSRFPKYAFRWPNLLLICTHCGRLKGDRFPQNGRRPLLINPAREDPWSHLTFDPRLGTMSARFAAAGTHSDKGSATADLLRLDRREALSLGYLKGYRRLRTMIEDALIAISPQDDTLAERLIEADDYGLLPWCVLHEGRAEEPFQALSAKKPSVWRQLTTRLS